MFGNPYTLFVLELCKHCGEPSPSSSQVGAHPMGWLAIVKKFTNIDNIAYPYNICIAYAMLSFVVR